MVLVTLDTMRADRLGCYGNPDGLTPNLDRLAGRSTLFEQAAAAAPITLPSHASLFTGRYPTATGVRNNGTFVLPDRERTLAEILKSEGWKTGAVVASYPLHSRYGLAQGFDRYDDRTPLRPRANSGDVPLFFAERDAAAVTDRALEVWREMGSGPRFLWVHYFDAHAPYEPPEPFASREAASPYDREVAFLDSHLGRLLEEIETSTPEAVVVVAGDHGEGLGEHGEDTHGVLLYEATLRVPLLIRAPGLLEEGERVSTPVSLVDVLPTVLGLLRLPPPPGTDGADLREVIRGEAPDRPLYAESYLPLLDYRFSPVMMIRDGDLKYVDAPQPELYDLGDDPGEAHNLHERHEEEERLALALAEFVARADAQASGSASAVLDPDAAARLQSLGYVGGGSTSLAQPVARGRDPKTMMDYVRREDEAVNMIANGQTDRGIALLQELIAQVPENYVARLRLGGVFLSLGRDVEAERELEAVVAADPDLYPARDALAEVQGRLGKLEQALENYRRAAQLLPGMAQPYRHMAKLLDSYGRFEQAAVAYLEAIEREPSNLDIVREHLRLREGRGELARGLEEIRSLAGRHPDSPGPWVGLGEGALRLGGLEEAAEAADRAVGLDPQFGDANMLQGEVRLLAGRSSEAEETFRRILRESPQDARARFGLARALLSQERPREAEVELAKVLEMEPTFSAAYTVRGRYLEEHGDPRAAADAYQRALMTDARDRDAAEGLARVVGRP